MYKIALLFLICSGSLVSLFGQPNGAEQTVNWGMKVGFNSAVPHTTLQTEYGKLTSNTINKVGYTVEAFMRMNAKRVYIQPEIAHCLTKESIHIQRENYDNYETFNIQVYSADASALCGYNTVKEDQFGLSLFSGCKMKYAYRINVNPSGASTYSDEEAFYNLYITTGLGVNIFRFFFDFRYDIALKENAIDVSSLRSADYGKISLHRKANILSFSVGFLF